MARIFTHDFNIMLGTPSGPNKSPRFLSFHTIFTNIFWLHPLLIYATNGYLMSIFGCRPNIHFVEYPHISVLPKYDFLSITLKLGGFALNQTWP